MPDLYSILFRILRSSGILARAPWWLAGWQARGGAAGSGDCQDQLVAELRERLHLMEVVTTARYWRGEDLAEALRRALATQPDYLPFGLEGVAFKHQLANLDADPREHFAGLGVIQGPDGASCPTRLSMLHIGAGMARAIAVARRLERVREAAQRSTAIVAFLRDSLEAGVPGHSGCLLEPAGLVAMTHVGGDPFVYEWARALLAATPRASGDLSAVAWMFHGLGRALYFRPETLLPGRGRSMQDRVLDDVEAALDRIARELPAEGARVAARNVVAGVAWAVAATSLTVPELLLSYLRAVTRDRTTLREHAEAFVEGIRTNLYMLHVAAPPPVVEGREPVASPETSFLAFTPELEVDQRLWRDMVVEPCRDYRRRAAERAPAVADVYRA